MNEMEKEGTLRHLLDNQGSDRIMNVQDILNVLHTKFGWIDLSIFVLMLVTCVFIGLYFAYKLKIEKANKTKDAEDSYLIGGRSMQLVPISVSLLASFISGITLLGTPTEVYIYGISYLYLAVAVIIMGFVMSHVYLPVFHDLKLTSTYHYLETRFDKRMRLFGSVLFTLGSMTWLPIVIYVPALAFNQATGINVHFITPIVCVVCIFYTCVGGLKAVVWTDVVQTVLMFGAMITIIVKGTSDVGGIGVVMSRAWESKRIEAPNYVFDLKERHTIYSILIGGIPQWLKSQAVSQNMIQRYLALPTLRKARTALWLFILGVLSLLAICGYSGLLIYAKYHDCDPLTTQLAKAKDQVLPLLVMETLGDFPGLPGLFVAGVFSAALSSLSTGLNSMSAVILEDFFKPFYNYKPLTKLQSAIIMRGSVVVFGIICVSLVFLVEKLGTVLQLSISLGAVSNGPLLGIFTLGLMVPWVEGKGAIIGGSTGLGLMAWLCWLAQRAIKTGELTFPTKPLSAAGCDYSYISKSGEEIIPYHLNSSIHEVLFAAEDDEPFKIYHISYLYYTFAGAFITIIVAVITSFLFGANKPSDIDPNLLAPFIRKLLYTKDELEKHQIIDKRLDPVGTEDNPAFTSSTQDLKQLNSISNDKKELEFSSKL